MSDSEAADRNKTVTLADVAELCGVAVSTVSRALSNPSRVNAVTRQRIELAAKQLDYLPNVHATALVSGRTKAIAVLLSDVTNPFYFDIIRGTQHQLKAAGYAQLLVDTEESDELEDSMLRRIRGSCDGAILAASRLTDRRLATLAAAVPLVAINRRTRGVPSVSIDTPGGVVQAVEHLVSLGHRAIAYAGGPETSWPNEARWHAFEAACQRNGATTRRLGPFAPNMTAGAAAADALLNGGATACVAYNDLLAIGLLSALAARGIRVPDDISIVGCDDIFGADFCNPPLTTLTAPIEQTARVAVSILLSQLDRSVALGTRRNATLPTHLTVRASTGPAPPA